MNNEVNGMSHTPLIDGKSSQTGKIKSLFSDNVLLLILIGLFIVGMITSPTFLRLNNIQNILINVTIYGLLAIGQSMVMLVKEIDLSIGSLVAFAPTASIFITRALMKLSGEDIIKGGNYVVTGLIPIIVFVLLISILIGLINGLITVKARVPSLIATLGMLYTLSGLSYVLSGGYSLYLTNLEGMNWLGNSKILGIPMCFLMFLIIGIIVIMILKYTKIGRRIYSTGGNEKAAIYSGINTKFWKMMAFAFCGLCAGISSLVYSSRLESVETIQGDGYELIALAIAVIGGITLEGGRGKIYGTLLASVILSVTLNILSLLGLVAWYQTIITGCIIIGAAAQYTFAYKKSSHQ
jgi:ribose/xylose/arabinose/galactoside ABC-type transport system permease subunit